MFKEFREFAVRGNVVDMAVGIIIGAAFGKIVASLVNDIVMPFVGTLMGGLNFNDLAIQFRDANIQYGKFIQSCVDFVIVAWVIFLAVKVFNRLRHEEPAAPPTPPRQEQLLEEIRDLLKKR